MNIADHWAEIAAAIQPSRRCKLGRHKFEARYDYGEPTIEGTLRVSAWRAADIVRASSSKTYIKDICVRCGKEVKRNPEDSRWLTKRAGDPVFLDDISREGPR